MICVRLSEAATSDWVCLEPLLNSVPHHSRPLLGPPNHDSMRQSAAPHLSVRHPRASRSSAPE